MRETAFCASINESHNSIYIDNEIIRYSNPSSVSMMAWIKKNSLENGFIIIKREYFAIGFISNTLIIGTNSTDFARAYKQTKVSIALEKWYHICVSFDGNHNECTIYIDGKFSQLIDIKGPLTASRNALYFGLDLNREYLNCHLSDVRILSKAVPIEEVKLHMNYPPDINALDLLGWWPLNHKSGTKVEDLSKNCIHGEFQSSQWVLSEKSDPVYPSIIPKDLFGMCNDTKFSDIRFRTKNTEKIVYAHKIILCQRSEVFRTMCSWNQDIETSSCNEINIPNIEYDILVKIMEYIYTDTVNITEHNVEDLYIAADQYILLRLKHLCECFMIKIISCANVFSFLQLANIYINKSLRDYCLFWIVEHFGEILRCNEFLAIDKDLAKEIYHLAAQKHFENIQNS